MINPVSGPAAPPQNSPPSTMSAPNPAAVQQFHALVTGVKGIAPIGNPNDPAMAQFQAGFVNGVVIKIFNQENRFILNGFRRND